MEILEIIFWIIIIIVTIIGIIFAERRWSRVKKPLKVRPSNEKDFIKLNEKKDVNFHVRFDPVLEGETFDYKGEIKCRVTFISKKGTVAINKIWQHKGEKGLIKMKIHNKKTNERIDGGWDKPYLFTVKENEIKEIFLIFYIEKIEGLPKSMNKINIKINTSEGIIEKKFKIRLITAG